MTHKVQVDNVVREATPEEIVAIEARYAKAAAQEAAAAELAAAKESALMKLAALGLTVDEIKALVG